MDTERGWQIAKRTSDADLFLLKGTPTPDGAVAVWALTPVTDFKMFERDEFVTIERLPELEHAGSSRGGGNTAA